MKGYLYRLAESGIRTVGESRKTRAVLLPAEQLEPEIREVETPSVLSPPPLEQPRRAEMPAELSEPAAATPLRGSLKAGRPLASTFIERRETPPAQAIPGSRPALLSRAVRDVTAAPRPQLSLAKAFVSAAPPRKLTPPLSPNLPASSAPPAPPAAMPPAPPVATPPALPVAMPPAIAEPAPAFSPAISSSIAPQVPNLIKAPTPRSDALNNHAPYSRTTAQKIAHPTWAPPVIANTAPPASKGLVIHNLHLRVTTAAPTPAPPAPIPPQSPAPAKPAGAWNSAARLHLRSI